jgi:hypothetical protein
VRPCELDALLIAVDRHDLGHALLEAAGEPAGAAADVECPVASLATNAKY